jgi:hypothetical protein
VLSDGTDPEDAPRRDCSGASREAGEAVSEKTGHRRSASFFEVLEPSSVMLLANVR